MKTDWAEVGITAGIALVVVAVGLALYHSLTRPDSPATTTQE